MHNISLMHEFTMLADTVLKINPHYWGMTSYGETPSDSITGTDWISATTIPTL